jgi:carbamoyltransferase
MLVLGLNFGGHDPAAAIVRDGELVCMAEQERFSRRKHAPDESPAEAASWCLRQARVDPGDVDAIAVGVDPNLFRPGAGTLDAGTALPEELLAARPPVRFVRHHLAHAASAFYCSGFREAAVLVVDGQGERESTSLAVADERGVRILEALPIHLSLGHFYRAAAQHAGLEPPGSLGAEGKLMGLAPYGVPDQPMPLRVGPEGLELLPEVAPPEVPNRRRLLRAALRAWWTRHCYPFADGGAAEHVAYCRFAASVQRTLEEAVLHLAGRLRAAAPSANLAVAGGVAQNCTANRCLVELAGWERCFFPPFAHDAGVALGAALQVEAEDRLAAGRPAPGFQLEHAFWGPEYDEAACASALAGTGLLVRRLGPEELVQEVAGHLVENRLVAWHQARAEVGPRALGARSLLADPRRRANVPRLNRVKGREVWRPLAPSVVAERFDEYFCGGMASPFMNVACNVRAEVRHLVPAVVHVDGSARPQALERASAPLFWSLVDAFGRRTGIPVLLNTSFNLAGEPIVNTPEEAVRGFLASELDVLALGPLVATKRAG